MAGGKQTPRQAMIGMMYLVLLAMLAMNASKDLLNAFVSLDNGITKTVKSFEKANDSFYRVIEKASASGGKYAKINTQAKEIKAKAKEVVDMMANHRVQLFSAGEIKSTADTANNEAYRALFENGIALNKDNQDIGGQFYVPGGLPSPDAVALKKVMDEFRELIVKTIMNDGDESNDYLKDRYTKLFNTEKGINPLELNGPEVTWVSRLAEHIPLAAVAANLTLWQSYVKNAEADVISNMASKMDQSKMTVNASKGIVQWENPYVLKGDSVKGGVFLAAYNDEIDPLQTGHWGNDATVEEIIHTINHVGHTNIYPDAFSLTPNSSLMSIAMDSARGGQFITIPNPYPSSAWYHYDDWTCDYQCMAIEYMYWCIVSNMGILDDPQTCNGIDNEWELCTPDLFESTDISMHQILTDPIYKLPQLAPDGNYCPSSGSVGDLNLDGIVNVLDVILIVNMVLGLEPGIGYADINSDGTINILDVIQIVNIILNN